MVFSNHIKRNLSLKLVTHGQLPRLTVEGRSDLNVCYVNMPTNLAISRAEGGGG